MSRAKLRPGLVVALGAGLLALMGAPDAYSKETPDGFDREAASAAMKAIDVNICKKKKGPTGDGHVLVTFAPSGSVAAAAVDRPPYAGTPVGKCVAKAFSKAKIPPFNGEPVNVGKNFKIE